MTEIWKDIKGFEGLYQVSNIGRVKSLDRKDAFRNRVTKSKNLKTAINYKGYEVINIIKDKKKKHTSVHRLVAIAFIPNPENKPQVNHKNGIKADNRIENLEWATQSENMLHCYKYGLQKPANLGRCGIKHPLSKPLLDTQTGIYYESITEAAVAKCINTSILSKRLRGDLKTPTSLIYV